MPTLPSWSECPFGFAVAALQCIRCSAQAMQAGTLWQQASKPPGTAADVSAWPPPAAAPAGGAGIRPRPAVPHLTKLWSSSGGAGCPSGSSFVQAAPHSHRWHCKGSACLELPASAADGVSLLLLLQPVPSCRRCRREILEAHSGAQPAQPEPQRPVSDAQQTRGYECVVCLDATANTFLHPCGHLLCAECAEQVRQCPTCRTAVHERRRFYA